MSQPTPGPWVVESFRQDLKDAYDPISIFDNKQEIAQVMRNSSDEANARLVAASPDLLAALKDLVARIEHNGGLGEYRGGPPFVLRDARAALAKAEGR